MQEMSYDNITAQALACLERQETGAQELLEILMDSPGVPMHDPAHHYIMPATLLTIAARRAGLGLEELREKLAIAEERARKLLPGFCGWWGACGSAVGCGVFASVWLGASPKKEENWAKANAFTARCLTRVSSVDGPRCCKRTSYLALSEAMKVAPEILGLNLGEWHAPQCGWSMFNNECRKEGCPFYHEEKAKSGAGEHRHLHAGLNVKR